MAVVIHAMMDLKDKLSNVIVLMVIMSISLKNVLSAQGIVKPVLWITAHFE